MLLHPSIEVKQAEAEMKRRGVEILRGDTKTSFHVEDPDGFEVQLGGLRQ